MTLNFLAAISSFDNGSVLKQMFLYNYIRFIIVTISSRKTNKKRKFNLTQQIYSKLYFAELLGLRPLLDFFFLPRLDGDPLLDIRIDLQCHNLSK